MVNKYKIYIWKKAPFLRLLLPVITGIILEFYLRLGINIIIGSAIFLIFLFIVFNILPLAIRFKLHAITGIIITTFMINAGLFLLWNKDVRNHTNWYGKVYDGSSYIIATINEPPVEKNKSYKALADVEAVITKDSVLKTQGNVLLYFAKDSLGNSLQYGDRIIIKNNFQPIKNSGNPGAFNYERYSSYQQIFYQTYLRKDNWILLRDKNVIWFKNFLFTSRKKVVDILDRYITGNDESSIAKALVIGYKVDLDKDLVQAYSNAGVVHLIAISGLHMGIIYGVLIWLFARIPVIKRSGISRLILILMC
ncbi:MAG: ComEC/Rec2 family competence protein, partial [Ginsengibacter sp.]